MIFFIVTFIFADQIKENTPTQENILLVIKDSIEQIIANPAKIDQLLKYINTLTATQIQKNIKKDSLE